MSPAVATTACIVCGRPEPLGMTVCSHCGHRAAKRRREEQDHEMHAERPGVEDTRKQMSDGNCQDEE